MRTAICVLFIASALDAQNSTGGRNFAERRQRAAAAFRDGVVLLHASSRLDSAADGFRQDPYFYYFTGLENAVGAVLAIDGRSGENWLFLPSKPPHGAFGVPAEIQPGVEGAKRSGIEHVVDWTELENFLSSHAAQRSVLYYAASWEESAELPAQFLSAKSPNAPLWLQVILQKWPALEAKDATRQIEALMEVQDEQEAMALRHAAKATAAAFMAGLKAIRPDVAQRSVETVVNQTCWAQGAHGPSFWPWVMAGENAVFPRPFLSDARYDHLDRTMLAGELVRLDVGCEWEHYLGDLGRTVPVSGHYDDAQRETWTIFVAAYKAGAKALREGVTEDQVFEAWQKELVSHRASARGALAQHAIDSWSDRKNVPFWQIHATNLVYDYISTHLRTGMTINFEPIASVDGQGFFLEDMYLINKDGAELLTSGVPYSAEEIEAAMR